MTTPANVDHDIDQELLRALTTLRIRRGLTQKQLASEVNRLDPAIKWTRSNVAAVEAGRRRSLRLREICVLCAVLDTTLPNLLASCTVSEQQLHSLGANTAPSRDVFSPVGAMGTTLQKTDAHVKA